MGGGGRVRYGRAQTRSGGGTYVNSPGIMVPEDTTPNNCVKINLKGYHYPLSLPRCGGGGSWIICRHKTHHRVWGGSVLLSASQNDIPNIGEVVGGDR